MSAILEAALAYATDRGWYVFPVGTDKRPHKAAKNSGGRPWGKTRDRAEIRWDFGHWPGACIGIACGPDLNIWVLDIDIKPGVVDGYAALIGLQAKHGLLPRTLQAISPSGSLHYYWAWPVGIAIANSTSKIGTGIDVRGAGGYVVAPPSLRDGVAYRWLNNDDIAEAPQWLIELATDGRGDRRDAPAHLAGANTGAGISTDADDLGKPTPETVQAALAVLDPDCSYDEWMRIGAACKDHQDLFVEWSSRSGKYPGKQACEDKAAEFARMPAITVATLFYLATEADPRWRKM